MIRSKGKINIQDDPDDLFKPAVAYIKSIENFLPNNIFFYGETLKSPKHNTIPYGRAPKNHIMLFGVCVIPDSFHSDYSSIVEWAKHLDVEPVPLIYKGLVNSFDTSVLDRVSYLGSAKIEGVVIKNYNKNVMITQDVIHPLMAAKFVSEAFKETNKVRWKDEEAPRGKLQAFFDQFKTEARWNKAIIHLKEQGLVSGDPVFLDIKA